MKKNVNFLVVIIVTILITLLISEIIIPNYLEKKAEREITQVIEEGNLPLPFPALTKYDTMSIFSILGGGTVSNEFANQAYLKVQERYAAQIKAVVQGINSDQEAVDYLEKSGLLAELSLDPQTALSEIKMINYSEHYFAPLSNFVQYNVINPPPTKVRYPAEYEPIGAVFLAWPTYYQPEDIWVIHANLLSEIVSEAEAWVLVPNEYWQKAVQLYLQQKNIDISKVKFFHINSEMVWTRDFAPITVLMDGSPIFIGNPYLPSRVAAFKFDKQVSAALGSYLDLPVYHLPVVIEGGNIITDGQGTVMMMESVLLNNPDVDEEKLQQLVKAYYGADNLIILPTPPGEITGHVDLVVKFIDQNTLLVASAPEDHHWHDNLEQVTKILTNKNYKVIRVPISSAPDESIEWSYINSLTLNNKVIVPIYGTPEDAQALEIYAQAIPDYEIVTVDEKIYMVGAVHCQTKEVPQVVVEKFIK